MHSISFLVRETELEWKLALNIQRYYSVPLYKPKAVYAISEHQDTAAGGDVQVPRGVIYVWRKAERQEIDTQIGKANPVLRKLHRSVATKRELPNTAKLSFFKSIFICILTNCHESWVMTERMNSCARTKNGILRRVHGVTKVCTEVRLRPLQETSVAPPYLNISYFGIKCPALNKKLVTLLQLFAAPQWFGARDIVPPTLRPRCDTSWRSVRLKNSQCPECWTTSRCWENTTKVSWAMYPECPTEDWWGKPCWLNPRESNPDVVQGLGGVTASSALLGPVSVWNKQNYLKLLLTGRYSKLSYACCPRNPLYLKIEHEN